MLSKTPQPAYDSEALFLSMFPTADNVDLANLRSVERRILAAYRTYDAQQGSSASILPMSNISQGLEDALTRCFNRLGNKGINPSNVRQLLIDAVPVCPYCGFGESAELDHVLPRSVWPEFMIHISNLVPICGKCNKHKLNRSFLTSGWSYRHPYFSRELPDRFLFVDAIITGSNVKYEFSVQDPSGMHPFTLLEVSSAFESFHLDERFSRRSIQLLSGRSQKIKSLHFTLGPKGVSKYFMSEGYSIAQSRGVNYWEAALYIDLSKNEEYCDFGSWQ